MLVAKRRVGVNLVRADAGAAPSSGRFRDKPPRCFFPERSATGTETDVVDRLEVRPIRQVELPDVHREWQTCDRFPVRDQLHGGLIIAGRCLGASLKVIQIGWVTPGERSTESLGKIGSGHKPGQPSDCPALPGVLRCHAGLFDW